jgi:methanogenic corrinoid protein MtbC1
MSELSTLVKDDEAARQASAGPPVATHPERAAGSHFRSCVDAIEKLDAASLEAALTQAGSSLSITALLDGVLVPLMETLGERWRLGSMNIYQEHMASAVVRSVLDALRTSLARPFAAPNIVVSTPPGHRHEIGALMAAVVAAAEGWSVTYLGTDLPPEEIAAAAVRRAAGVVGLSIVYEEGNGDTVSQLQRLRALLPRGVAILVGGRAAGPLLASLDGSGLIHVPDLPSLRAELSALREQARVLGRD